MTAEQIRKWIGFLGESSMRVQGEWANTHCPLAAWRHGGGVDRNPSFGISIEPGESRVHCFSCKFSGTQTHLLRELKAVLGRQHHSIDFRSALRMIAHIEDEVPELALFNDEEDSGEDFVFSEKWLETFAFAFSGGQVHPYLRKRRVPYEVAVALDLRFMRGEERICFPIRNFDGDLVGLHGRSIHKDVEPRYRMMRYQKRKNPQAWLGEHWVDFESPVVVTESVFDLARVYQVYRNVVCPLTSSLNVEKIHRMCDRCDHIVTMFDPDEAGDLATSRIDEAMVNEGSCVIQHVHLTDRDPGDLGVFEVAELLESYVDLNEILT